MKIDTLIQAWCWCPFPWCCNTFKKIPTTANTYVQFGFSYCEIFEMIWMHDLFFACRMAIENVHATYCTMEEWKWIGRIHKPLSIWTIQINLFHFGCSFLFSRRPASFATLTPSLNQTWTYENGSREKKRKTVPPFMKIVKSFMRLNGFS